MTYPSPFHFLLAFCIGILSAWFSRRTGKNPYLWFAIGFLLGFLGVFAILYATRNPQKSPPAPTIIGPKDRLWYYVDSLNNRQGPMSHDALTRAWQEGKISPSTYVWHEGLPEWKPFKEMVTS